ncbi:MAG TPA: PGPGW domain-containing protein [Candidatus Binataceae bacterium]|nr:PGPGW domain-containing protein [Candidatus Binataceae bacterium]
MRRKVIELTLKQARRLIVVVVGFTVILVGALMLVTPGPGGIFIFAGLSILGAEFIWARRLLMHLKRAGAAIKESVLGTSAELKRETPPDDAPPKSRFFL